MASGVFLVTVVVRDYDEAIEFYVRSLGFELLEDTKLDDSKRWVRVGHPSGGMALLLARAVDDAQRAAVGNQAGGRVFLFIQTDDFSREYQQLRARGVRFVRAPMKAPYGTVAVFEDLYGNRFDLIGPSGEPPTQATGA